MNASVRKNIKFQYKKWLNWPTDLNKKKKINKTHGLLSRCPKFNRFNLFVRLLKIALALTTISFNFSPMLQMIPNQTVIIVDVIHFLTFIALYDENFNEY